MKRLFIICILHLTLIISSRAQQHIQIPDSLVERVAWNYCDILRDDIYNTKKWHFTFFSTSVIDYSFSNRSYRSALYDLQQLYPRQSTKWLKQEFYYGTINYLYSHCRPDTLYITDSIMSFYCNVLMDSAVAKDLQLWSVRYMEGLIQQNKTDSLQVFFDSLSVFTRHKPMLAEMGKVMLNSEVWSSSKIVKETATARIMSITVYQDKRKLYEAELVFNKHDAFAVVQSARIIKYGNWIKPPPIKRIGYPPPPQPPPPPPRKPKQ
ncbi:MAG: hypothetical protein IM638_12425 [Bacteroidetes bacterium]|nr:hypothetical protein [Bacteroidota bacterium]